MCASGNGDSSPSRDKANKPSATEQPDSNMASEDGEKMETVTDSAIGTDRPDNLTAASTPQRAPAQEGVLQTPQRMASASAFSVFMSPLVRGSGRSCHAVHALHCCCASQSLPANTLPGMLGLWQQPMLHELMAMSKSSVNHASCLGRATTY